MNTPCTVQYTPNDRLWIALDGSWTDEEDVIATVKGALEDGADPNLMLREFGNFRSAMTLACINNSIRVANILLDAGALPHWAGDDTDIDTIDLCGEEDVGYSGHPTDPLVVVAGKLAWVLGEYAAGEEGQILALDALARRLIERGAPIKRPDPAIARTPLDHLLIDFTDAGGDAQVPLVRQILGDLMFDGAMAVDPQSAQYIVDRQWKKLPFWGWEWHEDFPELADYLGSRAAHIHLGHNTPEACGRRGVRL